MQELTEQEAARVWKYTTDDGRAVLKLLADESPRQLTYDELNAVCVGSASAALQSITKQTQAAREALLDEQAEAQHQAMYVMGQ